MLAVILVSFFHISRYIIVAIAMAQDWEGKCQVLVKVNFHHLTPVATALLLMCAREL